MPEVSREKELNVSVESLYKAITDFENYPKVLQEVVSVKVDNAKPDQPKVTFELELIKRFEYTLEFNLKKNELAEWKLVKSNIFKTNNGAWKLQSMGPNKVMANYSLDVAFGFLVPGWVVKKLTETNLPKMFDSFEARAKEIEGK